MYVYEAKIGQQYIEFLCGGVLALAAVLEHVANTDDTGDPDLFRFDSRVLQVLRGLDADDDGSITEDGEYGRQIWFEGLGYPILVVS